MRVMANLIPTSKCHGLSSKTLVCFICFVCGCTVSFSFLSSLECKSSPMKLDNHLPSHEMNSITHKDTSTVLSIVVLIVSAPENLQKRHILRRTWLSLVDRKLMKYFFVIGNKSISDELSQSLSSEQEHYLDLLILPEVEEGYDVLTRKVLRSFVWVYEHLNFEHVLKVDDDSFVDSRRLLMELQGKRGDDLLYWGYFNGHAQVQHRGKWKDTEWNLCDRYIPYARGGGYILSRSVVRYLSQNAPLLKVYKNEDVSVGIWLAPLIVRRHHDVRFDTEWTSRGCSNEYLITHPHDEESIEKLHQALTDLGKICRVEYQKRPAYTYDWSTLPSRCCSNMVSKNG